VEVSAGGSQTCTLLGTGGLRCWGGAGLVGDGTRANRLAPVEVAGLSSGVASVQLGLAHACALTTSGMVYCWGQGTRGQLGTGGIDDALSPVAILAQGHQALGLGENHSCAVDEHGDLLCWGANDSLQLGALVEPETLTPLLQSALPVPVPGAPQGIRLVAGGRAHTCVVTLGGEVFCWGANEYGQLGRATPGQAAVDTPLPVTLPGKAMAITAGQSHSCALLVGGDLRCWGRNPTGALGNDTGLDSPTPCG
jgi:alpha-tubulin suppressor-like RCC1 family protein